MLLRSYRSSDLETLYQIDEACFPPTVSYSRQELSEFIIDQKSETWIAEEDGVQIDAKFTDSYLSIDAKVGEGREISQAVKAAHQLLGHVSGLYSTPTRRRQHLASQVAYYPGLDFA